MLNNYLQTDRIPTDQQPGRGKLVGQKPPLKPKEVWSIRALLQLNEKVRDLALFNVAIDSKLRSCDLVALRVSDVAVAGSVRERAVIVQQKTGHPVQFELTEQTREASRRVFICDHWIPASIYFRAGFTASRISPRVNMPGL